MKITVNRISILKALIPCSTIIAKKSTFPIIDNVLIEGKGNKLLFRTTSLNTEVLSTTNTEDDVTGFKCLMPCDLLLRSIKSIRAEDLTLRIKEKEAGGTTLHIKTKKGNMKIEGVPFEEFPKTKYEKIDEFATISNNKIFDSIKSSLSFIQANDTRPALTCLSLKLVKDSLTIKAMSSTHGGKIEMKNVTNSFDVEFDISIQKQLIASFFNIELEGPFNIHVNDKVIIIKNNSTMFICDLFTEAKFPNVEPIYAQKEVGYFVVNPKELVDTVNRVCNLSEVEEKGGRTITFTVKEGMKGVEVASESYLGASDEINEIISDETKGGELTQDVNIRINAVYLQSVLQCCDTEYLNCHIQRLEGQYNKPIFFSYDNKSAEGDVIEEKEFVLMPML
jgi:DNA polymerase III sliding clamp (beta) subunit (PCNA family)